MTRRVIKVSKKTKEMFKKDEKIIKANKLLEESEDVLEILESLAVINDWDEEEETLWEFINDFLDDYKDAVIDILYQKKLHSWTIAKMLYEFQQDNEGCTMFDEWIEENGEKPEED